MAENDQDPNVCFALNDILEAGGFTPVANVKKVQKLGK